MRWMERDMGERGEINTERWREGLKEANSQREDGENKRKRIRKKEKGRERTRGSGRERE